jgi:hypothetical protein
MSKISIKNKTINWEILRGVNAYMVIKKSTGWAMYDEIRMDFKPEKDINSFPILRINPGNGITIDGVYLIVNLTKNQTTVLKGKLVHADIKLRIGAEVDYSIPYLITIKESVTKL